MTFSAHSGIMENTGSMWYVPHPAAGQLHDMWNTLIFEPEAYLGREDSLAESLTGIAASLEAAP